MIKTDLAGSVIEMWQPQLEIGNIQEDILL